VKVARTVLVVDDDPEIHDLVQIMAAPNGWQVARADSGDGALENLKAGGYDVVLTDILMPGMNGLTLMNRIREVRPDSKVVVMTALNTPDHIIGSLRESAVGYLRKPFSRELLVETLEHAAASTMQADDIQVMSDRPNWIAVKVRCKLATADRLTQFFRELPGDLASDERDSVATAFRELLMNAIEHGGRLDPEQFVDLSYIRTSRSIVYYIRDPGNGFSMDKLPHAAISNPPDSPFRHTELLQKMGIRPGGFGLLLTKNFADELIYSGKGNEVVLIKYL